MFGFGKIEVFPVSFHDGHITFRTPKKIGVGKSVKVKLLLAGQDSPSVSLKITEMDENLDDFTGVGLLKERQKRIDALTYQMALAGVEGACRRSTKRVAATIRLRSRQLPNYRGITANVNETGVEVNTDGALPVGTPVNLEFDVPEMADLSMQAISIWSTNEPVIGKGTFRAGVEFTETNREVLDAWSAFYRRVLESEGASVMMKTMGDGGDAGANYNTRESGRQTSVLESDQVKDELEQPVQAPPTPNFQPPAAASSPPFNPPASGFQAPTGAPVFPTPNQPPAAPTFQPPAQSAPPAFPTPAASQPPPFQATSAPRFDIPSFPGTPSAPATPQFPPAPSSGAPSFSPPGSPGVPSFSAPGQVPSFGAPSAPNFGSPPPSSPPPSPQYGGAKTPKPPSSLKLDTSSPAAKPTPTFPAPSSPSPQFPPPAGSHPSFGQPSPPSFGQPSSPPQFGQSSPLQFGSAPASSGFQPPPPPPGFQPPPPPAGFQPPPPPPGFQPPASTPERVVPMKMSGANLMFRCREGHRYQAGSQVKVELSFQFQGQMNSVVVRVGISGVQAEQDGTFSCIGVVHEDAQKIQVLNQVIGS